MKKLLISSLLSLTGVLSSLDVLAQAQIQGANGQTYIYYPDGSVQKGPGMINNTTSNNVASTNKNIVTTPKDDNVVTRQQRQAVLNSNNNNQQIINPGSITQVIPGVVTYTPAQTYGYGVPAVTIVNPYYSGYVPTNNTGVLGYGLGYIAGARR